MESYLSRIQQVEAILSVADDPVAVARAIIRGTAWTDVQKLYAWATLPEEIALAMLTKPGAKA